eukprot:TRINITY_DN11694_c0_g1_i4.p1 TRINITY_DN11694_c0_g1~~TRINITY_DN11694_c0_g1_i4.p1  ORF type:complete len:443 (+),score=119.67 TRINITY_DN11694_c0_g1_i4:2-1330(+)
MHSYGISSATKAAVESLSCTWANEMRGRNVTVNAVAPGPTGTELFLKGKSEEVIQRLVKLAPLERLGKPEDVANVISFLAGPEGGWINGQVIRSNGGMDQAPTGGRMDKIIVVTGASSGFGRMMAHSLAHAGHTVYAGIRATEGRNAACVVEYADYAGQHGVDVRSLELDVQDDESVRRGIGQVLSEHGRIDVVVHNAGHMAFGPAEAFTPAQLASLYDVNVLSTQRVNRMVLPGMRQRREGLVVWISSSSTRGGTPPYLGPYFAAKAGMDALAVSYAGELARWEIETTIVVPGAFTKGTNHFLHASAPTDEERNTEYDTGPYEGLPDVALKGLASLEPADADPQRVADAVVEVVGMPFGARPFRVHIDPSGDGAEVVNAMADRIRAELLRRIGLEDVLSPVRKQGRPPRPQGGWICFGSLSFDNESRRMNDSSRLFPFVEQ